MDHYDDLRKRGFTHNGSHNRETHYVRDLEKGYIYCWVNSDKNYFAFTHNKTSIAKGAERIFKKHAIFFQRLDEALATIK